MSVSSSTYAPQIERETNAVIGGKNVSAERSGGGRSGASGGPTVAVVSLVIALRGDAMKRLGLDRSVSSMSGEHILYRNTGPLSVPVSVLAAFRWSECLLGLWSSWRVCVDRDWRADR